MTKTEYDLQVFENAEFGKLRILVFNNDKDDVYFIGKEVGELFGDTNYRRSLSKLDDEDKTTAIIETNGGKQKLTIITESGFYSLLFAMQPQKAKGRVKCGTPLQEDSVGKRIEKLKKFKRWVTSEVLPMIRKTGGYVNNEEQFINTYLPNADEATRLMFKTHLATIKNLNDKVGELNNKVDELTTNNTKLETINTELTVTNAALTEQINTWDKRKCLNALVRSYGAKVFNGDIRGTWKEIYRQLNYYLGINVWNRQKNKNVESRLDTLNEDEIAKTVKMVSALCEQHGMNVGRIIGKTNKNIIDNIPAINAIAIC